MGLVKELAKESIHWKVLLQLYQYLFATDAIGTLTEKLDDMIPWYAHDLYDESYTGILEIVTYLRFGDTNKGLAEIRKQDALDFVSKYPAAAPVVYRLVKHSGVFEERFRLLFKDNEAMEQVIEKERNLQMSSSHGPFTGSAAMFLAPCLEYVLAADRSGALSKSTVPSQMWFEILITANTCSKPSASLNECSAAIEETKTFVKQQGSTVEQHIKDISIWCLYSLPTFKDWINTHILTQ
jgi:hypothetical protein